MLPRSTRFPFKDFASALVLGAAVIAAGCSSQAEATSFQEEPTKPLEDQNASGGNPGLPTVDGGASKPVPYRGNPLCRVTTQCMPDDDGFRTATRGTAACTESAVDAGAAETSKACRIARDESGVVAPTCRVDGDGHGGDGTTCTTGSDCGAGFDCVAGEKGSKTCRHYCCTGSCKMQPSQNGGTTFCDVQPLVDVNHKAPVCMPLKRCTLLGTGECSATESCAVVTESGDTGCVTIGDGQVGASCDEDHCAAKLTCLGQVGSRKCFKLCNVSGNDCPSPQTCETSTVFKNPAYGICQKP